MGTMEFRSDLIPVLSSEKVVVVGYGSTSISTAYCSIPFEQNVQLQGCCFAPCMLSTGHLSCARVQDAKTAAETPQAIA